MYLVTSGVGRVPLRFHGNTSRLSALQLAPRSAAKYSSLVHTASSPLNPKNSNGLVSNRSMAALSSTLPLLSSTINRLSGSSPWNPHLGNFFPINFHSTEAKMEEPVQEQNIHINLEDLKAASRMESSNPGSTELYYEALLGRTKYEDILNDILEKDRATLLQNNSIREKVAVAFLGVAANHGYLADQDKLRSLMTAIHGMVPQQILQGTEKNPLIVQNVTSWKELFLRFGGFLAFMLIFYLLFFHKTAADLGGLVGKTPGLEKIMSTTKLADVKGNDEAKEELSDIVGFLQNPETFSRLGAVVNKGILLIGPPGCGKTLLARALAGEAGVPFFYASGSDFEEMFVGLGARRMRELFKAARQSAPCIIFIDEIDAVGGRRDINESKTKLTLNQLLTELDGFNQTDGIIVIAATNSPDTLDPALVRPGRFNRKVLVDYPDVKARKDILDMYIGMKGAPDVDTVSLAKQTTGFSGAALNDLVNTATIEATKKNLSKIPMHMFVKAKETTILGPERKTLHITPEVKAITAYHEAGHTIVGYFTSGGDQLVKATLVPRGNSLGVTYYMPTEEMLTTKESMLGSLDSAMGGRVAEELIFGPEKVTQGAGSDFEQATRIARAMVMKYGMGKRVGKMAFSETDTRYLSSETLRQVETEIKELLDESYVRAQGLLTKRKKELVALAEALLEYETLSAAEIETVIKGGDLKSQVEQRRQEELLLLEKEIEYVLPEYVPPSHPTPTPQLLGDLKENETVHVEEGKVNDVGVVKVEKKE